MELERIKIDEHGHWADIAILPSGLCVVEASDPDMFVAMRSRDEMIRMLPVITAHALRDAAIRKGKA